MGSQRLTKRGLRRFLDTFHRTYVETMETFIPTEEHHHLPRHQYLSWGVIGYLSTTFGAGYEYVPSPAGTVIRVSDWPIADLFCDAPPQVRSLPAMLHIEQPGIRIVGIGLEGAFPLRVTNAEASVTLEGMRLTALGWDKSVFHAELYGDNSSSLWSESNAVAKAKPGSTD